jgi:aminomethyltransferase
MTRRAYASTLAKERKRHYHTPIPDRFPHRLQDGACMSLLRTPLYDWHASHRGRIVEFGGWEMPVQYSTIIDEHNAVRTSAGMFDVSHMGRLSFAGPNALDLIQHVYSNNAATMKEMQVRYGLVCNDKGGVRDDVLVYRWPYGWAMVVNASNRIKIVGWLEQHTGKLDVQINDQTTSTVMIAVQGPKAIELCKGLTDGDPSTLAYYYAMPTRYKCKNCVVSRTGYTGEDGLEFMVAAEQGVTLWEELVGRGVKPCGLGARDTLRLEAAMPLYGHEITEEIDPLQAGLMWAVKLDKGDFIGREAMLKRKADTSRPIRVGLELAAKRIGREGSAVLKDGKTVGRVTSGTFSPTLQKAIAMAYIEPGLSAAGIEVEVDVRGTGEPAKVTALPFYKREKK